MLGKYSIYYLMELLGMASETSFLLEAENAEDGSNIGLGENAGNSKWRLKSCKALMYEFKRGCTPISWDYRMIRNSENGMIGWKDDKIMGWDDRIMEWKGGVMIGW